MSPVRFFTVAITCMLMGLSVLPAAAEDAVAGTQPAEETPAPPAPTTETTEAAAPLSQRDIKETISKYHTLKADIKRCADFQERSTRLTCYDDISQNLGYMEEARVKKDTELLKKIGFWQVTESATGFGQKIINLRLESTTKIESKNATFRHVYLVITCKPGKTDVFIDWKLPVISNQKYLSEKNTQITVNYRVNDSEIIAEFWELSADKHAFFAPDGIGFVRNIMNKKKLVFEMTTNFGDSEAFEFDVSGVEKATEEIVKGCY